MKLRIETNKPCTCGRKQSLKITAFPKSKKVQYVCTHCGYKADIYTTPRGFDLEIQKEIQQNNKTQAEILFLKRLQKVVDAIFKSME